MSSEKVDIPGIGSVVLAKRRGTKHIKLSVTASGAVRVSLPYWAPYSTGIKFAKTRSQWIMDKKSQFQVPLITHGTRIGKTFSVIVNNSSSPAFRVQLKDSYLNVS